MSTIVMDKKEELVMRLVHYFITQENYTPIVVNGVKNEVWLENFNGPFRIVRINSNYIHNNEQLRFDLFKTKNIIHQIKRKTMSFKMNVLNIFLDLNEGVSTSSSKNIDSIFINNIKDINKNKLIIDAFPSIKNNLLNDTKGIDLIINVTNDINKKTAKENKKYEKIFSPKKIIITPILIFICVAVFMLTYFNSDFLYMLANSATKVKEGQIYRLFTSMFVHANFLHLLCNMYSLYIIGNQIETVMGKIKYILIYLISGITGNLLSFILTPGLSVGASGAIFGLMGSLLYFGYHHRLYLSSVIKTQIIPLIIINLGIGFITPGIDNAAHIGGLIGGYLITQAVGIEDKTSKKDKINGFIVLILLIAFLIYFGFNK